MGILSEIIWGIFFDDNYDFGCIGVIGEKYTIIKELDHGGQGIIYLVKDNKTNKIYAAKTSKNKKSIKNEIYINKIIKNLNNSNIVRFIESGEDTFSLEGEETMKREYIIFEYCAKGNLYKYLTISKGFKTKVVKIIFKKILETIEIIHSKDIYHFDLKVENILIDNDYNIKIGDFGVSRQKNEKKEGKFTGKRGTRFCMCPQMFLQTKDKKNVTYSGSKADIFSLGVILFNLLIGKNGFTKANDNCDFYKLIKNDKNKYFEKIEKTNAKKFPDEFKELYLKMVSFKENDRPSIQDILNNELFNDINNLSEEKKKEIIKEELKSKEILINKKNKKNVNCSSNKKEKKEAYGEKKRFYETTIIRCIRNENIYENYIKINGNLNPIDYMNEYANEMNNLFDDIESSEKYLKFNIIIKKEVSEIEENNNDLNNNSLDLENINEIERDMIIKVELLKLNENEFILSFIKGNGSLRDYYEYLEKVMKYAEDFI